jgi:hypothetical protein
MVAKNKRRVNGADEYYYEEEYEPSFNKASNESDNSLLFLGGLIGLAGLTDILGTLSPVELEEVRSTFSEGAITATEEAASFDIPGIGNISEFMPDSNEAIALIHDAENLSPEELSHLEQMMEEAKQYGRMSDPKTAENITFNNQSSIAEQAGQFGYHESSVQGNLEVAKNEGILFPWVSVGDDNVCDECLELEADGPYPADDYPESPHYGDRCNEPFPDPSIALSGEVEDENKYSFDEPLPTSLGFGKLEVEKAVES